MIPVAKACPPSDFEARVRRPGLDAIAELVGETPSKKRRGPKRDKAADSREKIPADKFPPLWRKVLPDMLTSYRNICAYLALYIEDGTGNPTVDHFVPKSKAWDKVYEWSNYRLACGLVNSKKDDVEIALDPIEIELDLFGLEFDDLQVVPGVEARGAMVKKVEDTIIDLGLNALEFCKARRAYVENYERGPGHPDGGIDLPYLERRAPFIARELRRQGRLLRGDV